MSVLIVAGALANKYRNGGEAWVRLSWVAGLRRLGFDVYFVEQIARGACVDARGVVADFAVSVNLDWFRSVTRRFDLAGRSALIYAGGEACAGVSWPALLEVASAAELLVNISGHLTLEPLLSRIRRRAYIDLDPGFTQCWHADPKTPFTLGGHTHYFTVGENIGSPGCPIPTSEIPWRPVRQPVVLDDWPVATAPQRVRFTTIASWRGAFGPVSFGGRAYGLKVHEFRKVLPLPQRVTKASVGGPVFELALDIHAGDAKDLTALHEHGWRVTDPRHVAGDPDTFRQFVQESGAEFSVAQGIYVETNSGWFSDRTVRYLASGKPALVQDTGFSQHYPAGEGLVPFKTLDEAVAGAEAIVRDYDRHCRAARAIAGAYFDSDKVLTRLLEEIGLCPQPS